MHVFGFSINALTLFGLVLAIGIVVDDAIVVVENVERNIEAGLPPREATYRAMREVSGPIIAIALVLSRCSCRSRSSRGLTGQFYKQFALTIAISTVISAFNSLTLSPALAAVLLKGHDAPKDWLTRVMDFAFGWFFRAFNRVFGRGSDAYSGGVGASCRARRLAFVVYAGPDRRHGRPVQGRAGGFVPGQDKQYLVGFAQLPDGATLDRTEDVIRRMSEIALKTPGVESAVAFPACRSTASPTARTAGIVFATLKPFDERRSPDLSGRAIASTLNQEYAGIKDAFIAMFPPPPVQGLGTIGGFKLQIEDRARPRLRRTERRDAGVPGSGRVRRRSSPGCSRPIRSTCRSSMRRSIARRRVSSASPSPTFSTRCRSISARSTSTTSTTSAAPIRCACRPMRSIARAPKISAC